MLFSTIFICKQDSCALQLIKNTSRNRLKITDNIPVSSFDEKYHPNYLRACTQNTSSIILLLETNFLLKTINF